MGQEYLHQNCFKMLIKMNPVRWTAAPLRCGRYSLCLNSLLKFKPGQNTPPVPSAPLRCGGGVLAYLP